VFDRIDHTALMDRVRRRIGDRRVLLLVKASGKPGFSAGTASSGAPTQALRIRSGPEADPKRNGSGMEARWRTVWTQMHRK
jgi:hypothetical protein